MARKPLLEALTARPRNQKRQKHVHGNDPGKETARESQFTSLWRKMKKDKDYQSIITLLQQACPPPFPVPEPPARQSSFPLQQHHYFRLPYSTRPFARGVSVFYSRYTPAYHHASVSNPSDQLM